MNDSIALARIEQARIVVKETVKLLGSELHQSLWCTMIQKLCHQHYTIVDQVYYKPLSNDVLYNLITYSHVAMQRLAYGRSYVTDWVDPIRIPLNSKQSYLVMLSVGFITWGTYDSLTKQMCIRLGDCEAQIPVSKLLAIHKSINDGQDFLRGVSLANFSALEHIKCDTIVRDTHIPNKVNRPAPKGHRKTKSGNRSKTKK